MQKQDDGVVRYPGHGAIEPDGPFTFQEYAEWAADEYERPLCWPWEIAEITTTSAGEHIFEVADKKGKLIIAVWLDEGVLHHEDQSCRPEYMAYLRSEVAAAHLVGVAITTSMSLEPSKVVSARVTPDGWYHFDCEGGRIVETNDISSLYVICRGGCKTLFSPRGEYSPDLCLKCWAELHNP